MDNFYQMLHNTVVNSCRKAATYGQDSDIRNLYLIYRNPDDVRDYYTDRNMETIYSIPKTSTTGYSSDFFGPISYIAKLATYEEYGFRKSGFTKLGYKLIRNSIKERRKR